MTESDYFIDAPIQASKDDQFGIDPFAQALLESIIDIKSPGDVTIALNGPWGTRKSSAVNLIRHHLVPKSEANKPEIIDFKCCISVPPPTRLKATLAGSYRPNSIGFLDL